MHSRTLRRSAIPLIAASTLALAGCGSGSSASASGSAGGSGTTTINVAFDSNATALPAWVAHDEGIFAKNHLKVNFTKIQNLSTLPGTLGNTFDIVLSTPTMLVSAATKGLPVIEVSGSSLDTPTNPTGAVVVSPSSGITSLSDLEGKSVGTLTLNGTLSYSLEYDLYQHHLNPGGVRLVVMAGPTLQDNLKAKNVPAVIAIPPFIAALTKAGNKQLLNPYDAVGSSLASIFWIGSKNWANSHPTAVNEFVTSLNQAQTWIHGHNSAARQILATYTGLPASVVATFTLPVFNTALRPGDLAKWEHVMITLGKVKNPPSAQSLMFTGK